MEKKVQQILTDLERVRENLLALSDDIWLNIEHNDSEAVQKGADFKIKFNDKLDKFNTITSEISGLIENFTNVHVESVDVAGKGTPEHGHIIKELDSTQPHTIDESFTYKQPYGFVFQGQAYKGINTWRLLYKLFCKQLAESDILRFREFVESPEAKSNRGVYYFSSSAEHLRAPLEITTGIYAESNLSANSIRDKIKYLLKAFDINSEEILLYLQEDRNAL